MFTNTERKSLGGNLLADLALNQEKSSLSLILGFKSENSDIPQMNVDSAQNNSQPALDIAKKPEDNLDYESADAIQEANLMDETFLSVMDTSVVHESHHPEDSSRDILGDLEKLEGEKITDLSSFLSATNVKFATVELNGITQEQGTLVQPDTLVDRLKLEIDAFEEDNYAQVFFLLILLGNYGIGENAC
jgi:hypothetical protein